MKTPPTELGTSRLTGRRDDGSAAPPPVKTLPAPLTPAQVEAVQNAVVQELHHVFDPEIPVNIYELGLIYDVAVEPTGAVYVKMTLTSPACPVAGSLPGDVQARLRKLANVTDVKVDVVWDPPWDKSRLSEAAKLQLGIED
jgi:FeS assembly SUF system protein